MHSTSFLTVFSPIAKKIVKIENDNDNENENEN